MTANPTGQAVPDEGAASPRAHHPRCGQLSVPDVLIVCWSCGGETHWCGCTYRCRRCEGQVTP